ncbi:PASTA domain-containing protein [Virgibacillus oceani]
MIDDGLSVMGVDRRTDGIAKEYQWPEEPLVEVPDLIGHSTQELFECMMDLAVDVNGAGDVIIDQEPAAGSMVQNDSVIRIFLGNK